MKKRLLAPCRFAAMAVGIAALSGCVRDALFSPDSALPHAAPDGLTKGTETFDYASGPPSGLVNIDWEGETLGLWPYTGTDFDGSPKDPVNLIFAGPAGVLEIRAALMGLDGDRTAYGYPAEFPFDATWADAIGNVQTGYSDGRGWVGSVVQLELGGYAPLRTHLRLFETGAPFGDDGVWVVGAAHFELTIPGTPEHQVLSWEVAEQIVVVDLLRSGLLAASPALTAVINDAPFYREIPAAIYNGIPESLKALIGGPAGSVTDPVSIPSDGRGTILHLAESVPIVADTWTQSFPAVFQQYIPKPFCSGGPLDWVLVEGPLSLSKTVSVNPAGKYRYDSSLAGTVIVTPVDITQNPPVPVGPSYPADVNEIQSGSLSFRFSRVKALSERIGYQEGGTELLRDELTIGRHRKHFRSQLHCLDGGE